MNHNLTGLTDKRVTIVLPSLELGGSERRALLLARYLVQEQGAQVQVWGFGQPGRAAELCDEYGILWRIVSLEWPPGRLHKLVSVARYAQALRRARTEIVLPYTYLSNLACGLAWRLAGARVCIWNQTDDGRTFTGQEAERLAIRLTRTFVSNSHHGASFLVKTLGVDPNKVTVIYNGVELAEPAADRRTWQQRLGVSQDCLLACMVANLRWPKDHTTLLKAWRQVVDVLREREQEAALVLAGRFDSTHEYLRALAYVLEIDKDVRFLGVVDDISGLLGAVDLGVLSSRSEGCSNSVLEYMAAGLAVAGTDIPGIREAVTPLNHPFLAPPGDAAALARCILELFNDPETRAKLGSAGRQRVAREFGPRRMCEEMTQLIVGSWGAEW